MFDLSFVGKLSASHQAIASARWMPCSACGAPEPGPVGQLVPLILFFFFFRSLCFARREVKSIPEMNKELDRS